MSSKLCSFLLFSALLFCTTLDAQPTLTISGQTPEIGETYEVHYAEVSNFDLGNSGANQNWDYSSSNWNSIEIQFSILAPENGLSNQDFPDADFVWFLDAFEAYNFYEVTENGIELIGGASGTEDDILFKEIFTDKEDALQLPATYQDNYSYFSAFTSYFFGTQTSATRNGTVEIDAYGTLTTPNGTYNNVLRMVITSSISTYPDEIETQYAWMLPGQFIPVMVYTISNDPESSPTVYYASKNIDTAVNSPENVDLGLALAGNPVKDRLSVLGAAALPTDARVQIVNTLGQYFPINATAGPVDLSAFDNGQYFLQVITSAGQQVLPFIKQM